MIDELFKSTHMLNENNFIERVRVVLKKCVFDLFYLLLKKNSTNLLIEIISLLFQFLHPVFYRTCLYLQSALSLVRPV